MPEAMRSTVLLFLALCLPALAQTAATLDGTTPLTPEGDLSAQMVAGIDKFLMRQTDASVAERKKWWQRDTSSPQAYNQSVRTNRSHLWKIIGAMDARTAITDLQYISSSTEPALVAETPAFRVFAVRWPVFENVFGDGLLLEPKGEILARIIAVPDADQTPEMIAGLRGDLPAEAQFARRLAENGCQVLVLALVDRRDTWSGNSELKRFTNQPHREWIYRQAYELGRHIIGYEVQKILAAVSWFANQERPKSADKNRRIGVAGYGEGGLLALYAAALDQQIDAALVSGYFDSRQKLWAEPIYRNVFGLLREFGDAELASLVFPRGLVVEFSAPPKVDGPPAARQGRSGAAPGKIEPLDFNSVEGEINRAMDLCPETLRPKFAFVHGNEGRAVGPGS
jgi:hypothetical protein